MFLANTSELVNKAIFFDFNPEFLFTGDDSSDYRVITTLERWAKGEFVDPPTVSIYENKDKLIITDGRHRTKLAYLLGHIKIPIAIQKSLIERIRRIIRLDEVV